MLYDDRLRTSIPMAGHDRQGVVLMHWHGVEELLVQVV